MRTSRSTRALRPLVVAVAVLLVPSACGSMPTTTTTTTTTSASSPGVTSTPPSPTTSTGGSPTAGPLTTKELAWLRAIGRLHHRLDAEFLKEGTVTVTPAKLRAWETLMHSCGKELTRLGDPGPRLRPVAALVRKACGQYDKGAACYASARRHLDSYAESKKVDEELTCGGNATGDGSNFLTEAEAKGDEIDLAAE